MNEAFMQQCSSIGILERNQDTCALLIPRGRFTVPTKEIRPEDCNRYLANEEKKVERFYIWKDVREYSETIKVFDCKYEKCDPPRGFSYSKWFGDCTQEGFRAWIGFREARYPGKFSLAECGPDSEKRRYFVSGSYFAKKIPGGIKPTEMIIGSSFYSTHTERSLVKTFLFETLNMVNDTGPVMLALDG